jgi:hypothetical protein
MSCGLEYVDIPEPDAPGPNQVLIGVEFSPINPNDLMVAQGIYAFRPPLPTVIGNEGQSGLHTSPQMLPYLRFPWFGARRPRR